MTPDGVAARLPISLKFATPVGIGLFIALIGLREGGVVVTDEVSGLYTLHLASTPALLTLFGLLLTAILLALRIRGAILWGLIAFLLNYIPNIGSFIAAVPAVLFAMIQLGTGGVIATIVVFVVANIVIGNVVEPRIMGKGLGLSTFVVFFSLIFWGFILGTVGMFLSVPLTIAIKIILEQYPSTRGFAIALGTKDEAQHVVEVSNSQD